MALLGQFNWAGVRLERLGNQRLETLAAFCSACLPNAFCKILQNFERGSVWPHSQIFFAVCSLNAKSNMYYAV